MHISLIKRVTPFFPRIMINNIDYRLYLYVVMPFDGFYLFLALCTSDENRSSLTTFNQSLIYKGVSFQRHFISQNMLDGSTYYFFFFSLNNFENEIYTSNRKKDSLTVGFVAGGYIYEKVESIKKYLAFFFKEIRKWQ